MADTKVSALTAATVPAEADIIYLVTAALASRKMVLSDLFPGFAQIAFASRTSGVIVLNSTSWADVDNGLDLTIPGMSYAGDIVEVGLSGRYSNENQAAFLDFASLNDSDVEVNYWSIDGAESGSSQGIAALIGEAQHFGGVGGSTFRALVGGDLRTGGVLKLRLRYRTFSAANKTLNATANEPLHVWAKNHGQPKT